MQESSSRDRAPAGAATDPEAGYYQAIEEFFVSRRGDPLFLSNPDWLLIRKWRAAGLPLRIVLRGIADALESHAHSWSRDRKVGSLAYCAAEVEAARERWQRALALEAEEGMNAAAFLLGFADTLEDASDLGPAASILAPALAEQLRRRAAQDVDPRPLEPWLAARERELLAALRRDLGLEAATQLEAAVDADLAAYRERMPAPVLAQVRSESISRRLLEAFGLPRLSLFGL